MPSALEIGLEKIIKEGSQKQFTADEIKSVLIELSIQMENETDKMALESDFSLQENKIIFTFPNALLAEKLGEYKSLIFEKVSLASGFSDWEIETEIAAPENKVKIYKTQDKFEAMKLKNPMLNSFKDTFNLDLDF